MGKNVEWIQGEPTVSYEWDMNGRLIRYSEKWEEENPTYGRLYLPSEYHLFPNKGFLDPFRVECSIDTKIREIKTEFEYRGDTEEIVSIQSVTGSGDVIAYLKRGEGDIILSASCSGSLLSRYRESYDKNTR